MSKILEISEVSKKIGKKQIIKELSFYLNKGEILGFLGPNGSGKTTTMRMITGLIGIDSGEILVNGISIKKDFTKAIQYVSAIIENPDMYQYLSGYKNLKLSANMAGVTNEEEIKDIVAMVGLTERIHDKVRTYSLGMKQRLGVAQALINSPELIILDEPTNGLDPIAIREFRSYFKSIAENKGIAFLVSSHLLSEVELMCDRVVMLQKGEKVGEFELNSKQQLRTEYCIETDQPEKCIDALTENFTILSKTEKSIIVRGDYYALPHLLKKLIEQGISIYTVQPVVERLEDVYMRINKD